MTKLAPTTMRLTAEAVDQDGFDQMIPGGYFIPECAQNCVWYEQCPEQTELCANRTSFVCNKHRHDVFRWLSK